MLATEDNDQVQDAWKADLADRIEEIIDRKRSSVQGREVTLVAYIRILTARYSEDDILGSESSLVTSFLKSIKAETSETETILAMKGGHIMFFMQIEIRYLYTKHSSRHDFSHFSFKRDLRYGFATPQAHNL